MDFEINEVDSIGNSLQTAVDSISVVIILVIAVALIGFLVYNLYHAPLYDDDFNEIKDEEDI